MLQVWFSIIPGHGHFFPYVPLARALQSAGHEVTFSTSKSYGETVRDHGFGSIDTGLDYTQMQGMSDTGDSGSLEEVMFVTGPSEVHGSLLTTFKQKQPDVMLVDQTDFGGMTAAEAGGIPWGCVLSGIITGHMPGQYPFDLDERGEQLEMTKLSKRLRAEAGLPNLPLLDNERPYDRSFVLSMVPTSLDVWPLDWRSHTAHPLRPEIHQSDSDDAWLEDLPGDRPVVSVSLGTLFGTPDLYEKAIEAALETDAHVVAATSFDLNVQHQRLTQTKWVSMDRLMEHTDVLIHHGGWGSTVAALASGTPSVVIPLGADQFVNATRIQATGAGVKVDRESTTEELKNRIEETIHVPVFRLNAERLQSEIQAMPPAEEVVPLIERLAETGPPLLNR